MANAPLSALRQVQDLQQAQGLWQTNQVWGRKAAGGAGCSFDKRKANGGATPISTEVMRHHQATR
jgi:hypothetical protein